MVAEVYNIITGTVTPLPTSAKTFRDGACGIVRKSNGEEFFLIIGGRNGEMIDIDSLSSWRPVQAHRLHKLSDTMTVRMDGTIFFYSERHLLSYNKLG